jgi:hypothetical protein
MQLPLPTPLVQMSLSASSTGGTTHEWLPQRHHKVDAGCFLYHLHGTAVNGPTSGKKPRI